MIMETKSTGDGSLIQCIICPVPVILWIIGYAERGYSALRPVASKVPRGVSM